MICGECGKEYDPTDLTQVMYHQKHEPVEVLLSTKGEPIRGVKIGDRCPNCDHAIPVVDLSCSECGYVKRKDYIHPTVDKNDPLTVITF